MKALGERREKISKCIEFLDVFANRFGALSGLRTPFRAIARASVEQYCWLKTLFYIIFFKLSSSGFPAGVNPTIERADAGSLETESPSKLDAVERTCFCGFEFNL